jgi:SAF domain-containing protein
MADSPEGLPVRRQWGRLAVGLSVALLGGWLFAALYLTAGKRVAVVVLARDVQAFQTLTTDDLTTERVAAGDRVSTIPGDNLDELAGHQMRVSLTEGTLLSTSHLVPEDEQAVGSANEVAGMELSRTDAPDDLRAGDPVRVVISSDAGDVESVDPDEDEVCGGAYYVGPEDERTGQRKVDIIVPAEDASRVQTASMDGRAGVTRRSSAGDTTDCDSTADGWGGGGSSSGGGDGDDRGDEGSPSADDGTGDQDGAPAGAEDEG